MDRVSRRHALQQLGLVAGGAGLATAGVASESTAAEAATPAAPLMVHATGLRTLGPRGTGTPGSTSAIAGSLAVVPGGPAVGELYISSTLLAAADLLDPGVGSLETQTFVLPGGTLVGTGVLHQNGTGTFAVTGGTGTYTGAAGSYTVTQEVDAFTGGTATYTFTLLPRKVAS